MGSQKHGSLDHRLDFHPWIFRSWEFSCERGEGQA